MDIKVKICGITTQEALSASLRNRADYVGFVFHKLSPRNLSLDNARKLIKEIPDSVKKVAVVVNYDKEFLQDIHEAIQPDYIQLDGDDTPEQVDELKRKYGYNIFKTIYVKNLTDLNEKVSIYSPFVDGFIFDSPANREMFVEQPDNTLDWGILNKLSIDKKWFLSGGLTKYNVKDAIRISGATMINASSSLESSPGIKDPHMIEDFIRAARG